MDGILKIYNTEGTQVGKWDANGINVTTGTFSGSLTAATGTFKGKLSAATGTFAGDISAATGTFSGVVNVKKRE